MSQVKYNRIILKISGEALAGDKGAGINPTVISHLAKEIKSVHNLGVEIGIVCGGGNMWRGETGAKLGMERAQADYMGMLATIMNGLAMREELKAQGGECVLMSAYGIPSITTQYSSTEGREFLNKGSSLIVAGGTGSPFFTTDTGAVLRAIELQCSEVLKATKVDGIYTADPVKDKTATKFDSLTFDEVIAKQLQVMDLTAFALAREHHMPIRVFSMNKPGAFDRAAKGESEGTVVSD